MIRITNQHIEHALPVEQGRPEYEISSQADSSLKTHKNLAMEKILVTRKYCFLPAFLAMWSMSLKKTATRMLTVKPQLKQIEPTTKRSVPRRIWILGYKN